MSDSWILTEMPCMARTPAPWGVATINDSYAVSTPEDEHGLRTCVCVIAGVQCPGSLAAAHLIAAAPELLAACHAVANDLRRLLDGDDFSGMTDNDLFGAFLGTLNAAISKAEGRE